MQLRQILAGVAQLVERDVANVEAAGSSPATRSIFGRVGEERLRSPDPARCCLEAKHRLRDRFFRAVVAQLEERLFRNQGVRGSIPLGGTTCIVAPLAKW